MLAGRRSTSGLFKNIKGQLCIYIRDGRNRPLNGRRLGWNPRPTSGKNTCMPLRHFRRLKLKLQMVILFSIHPDFLCYKAAGGV
jgi:hypothetical protein